MNLEEYQDQPFIVVDDYFATAKTFAIVSHMYKDQLFSIAYDFHGKYLVKKKPLHIIRDSCRMYGFTYAERVSQSKNFFQNKHKLPIILEHDFSIPLVLFPLYSPKSEHNIWLSAHAIKQVYSNTDNCDISFLNNNSISIPATLNVVRTQFFNATLFSQYLQIQKKERRKRDFDM